MSPIFKSSFRKKAVLNIVLMISLNVVVIYLICSWFFNVKYFKNPSYQPPSKKDLFMAKENVKHKVNQNLKNILFRHKLAQDEILLKSKQFQPQKVYLDEKTSQGVNLSVNLEQEDLFEEILSTLDQLYPDQYYNDVEDYIIQHIIIERAIKRIKDLKISGADPSYQNYTEQFLLKARKRGYDIQLNQNLDIISMKKVSQHF